MELNRRGLLVAAGGLMLAAAGCGNRNTSNLPGAPAPGGSGSGSGSKGSFKIGLLNPLTGPYAQLGADVNAALELFLQKKNNVLGGYSVQVLKEDETTNAAGGTTKARQLVEQNGVDVIVGLVNSGTATGVAGYLKDKGTPLIITVAGADGLTQRAAAPNVFRVSYTSSQDSMPMADYALKELKYQKIALVALDYGFGWESAGGFARVFTDGGGKIVQELYSPLNTPDWGSVVQKLDKAADAVFITAAGADAQRFFQAYKDFGVKVPVIAHGSTTDEQLLQQMGPNAQGVISSLHYSRVLDTPTNNTFRKDFESAEKRDAGQYADAGWVAGQMLEAALTKINGKVESKALIDGLASASVDAPRGKTKFDAKHQAEYPVYIRKVEQKDGKWANSVIKTYENVSQFWSYGQDKFLTGEPFEKLKGTWVK